VSTPAVRCIPHRIDELVASCGRSEEPWAPRRSGSASALAAERVPRRCPVFFSLLFSQLGAGSGGGGQPRRRRDPLLAPALPHGNADLLLLLPLRGGDGHHRCLLAASATTSPSSRPPPPSRPPRSLRRHRGGLRTYAVATCVYEAHPGRDSCSGSSTTVFIKMIIYQQFLFVTCF
jgi:hypothetical protein